MDKKSLLISPYKVLDLTDVKGWFCGKLLGDLGADVIKIEPPGGELDRNLPPFLGNESHPEKSLYWHAYNTNKKGITLDIGTSAGKNIFAKMVQESDIVIESFAPGYLHSMALDYDQLVKIKHDVIMVSITPFGQSGPHARWKANDLVIWAMGGAMYTYGFNDQPPTRISHHSQAYLHAGADAAMGAMMALYWRRLTGEGQQVDVSIQESVAQTVFTTPFDLIGTISNRGESVNSDKKKLTISVWRCKDGWVSYTFSTGVWGKTTSIPFVKWMEDEGILSDYLKSIDWEQFDANSAAGETLEKINAVPREFFLSRTKSEIMQEAAKRGIRIYPLSTVKDLLENPTLLDRNFWQKITFQESDISLTYPGGFIYNNEISTDIRRCAPSIGEHNQEIYQRLGLTVDQINQLKETGII